MFVNHAPATDKRELSPENAEIVRATLPIIGANINKITPIFYNRMFTAHPELIADTFNRGNQRSGEQQKALAASIATFAAMLVDPEAPDPREMLARIGHKHVSLGITKDQYQIVHDNLFAAIVEVLGEAITPEVAGAWDDVYWLMAEVLIDYEAELYASAGVTNGEVFKKAALAEKRQLSDRVTQFRFTCTGFGDALPGQYTSIGVRLPDGARQLRQYSLVDFDSDGFTIAVQRDGEVSNFLFDSVEEGTEVDATLPAGDLVLDSTPSPVVLLSQGIGSTPMVGMLSALAAQGDRDVLMIHADASRADYAQAEVAEQLVAQLNDRAGHDRAQHITAFRDEGGMIDLAELAAQQRIPQGAQWYLCGGNTFLQDVRQQLQQHEATLAPTSVHFELFSPNDWLI